jgi:hypothetical protein
VDDGQVSHERLIVDEARFAQIQVGVEPEDDQPAVLRRVEHAIQPLVDDMEGRMTALRIRLTGSTSLFGDMAANRQQWRDEVEAACHRIHQDIWLEKLELRIEPPPTVGIAATGTSLDLPQLLGSDGGEEDAKAEADRLIAEIAARLPGGLATAASPLGDAAETLIEEARQLLLARGRGAA